MLETIKVVLEIAQIGLGGLFVFGLWSLKAGRWLERHDQPLSVVPPKAANGNGEWRAPLEAVKVEVAKLRAEVDGGETRRADLMAQNEREHDGLTARIDRNEALISAHQRRLDDLSDQLKER